MLFPVFRFHSVYEPVPEWLSHRYRDLLVKCYNVKWPSIKVSVSVSVSVRVSVSVSVTLALSHTILAFNPFQQQHLNYTVQVKACLMASL